MRIRLLLLAAAALAMPAVTAAGPAPSRSAAQIVCELTGDCTGAAGGAQASRPAEAAFSFSKPGQGREASALPPSAAQKPAKIARVERPAPRPVAAVPAPTSGGIDMRITFANGSAEMTPQGRAEAAQFAKAMAMPQLASRRFAVEGHTNAVGDAAFNRTLSERRAEAVSAYLVSQGVEKDRLEARGYGFDRPLPGRGATAAANRRVQFVPLS